MKRIYIVLVALCLLAIISCKKSSSTANAGSWTFKSQTYHATFGGYILGALTAYTGDNTPTGSLAFYFPDTVPTAGSYIVTNDYNNLPPAPGYVYVALTDTSVKNVYVISGSTHPSVTVTVTGGKATVNLPPVEMYNVNTTLPNQPPLGHPSHTDSALVTGTIIQTQ